MCLPKIKKKSLWEEITQLFNSRRNRGIGEIIQQPEKSRHRRIQKELLNELKAKSKKIC